MVDTAELTYRRLKVYELQDRIAKTESYLASLKRRLVVAKQMMDPGITPMFDDGVHICSIKRKESYIWSIEYVHKAKRVYVLLRRRADGTRVWKRLPFYLQTSYKIVELKQEN